MISDLGVENYLPKYPIQRARVNAEYLINGLIFLLQYGRTDLM